MKLKKVLVIGLVFFLALPGTLEASARHTKNYTKSYSTCVNPSSDVYCNALTQVGTMQISIVNGYEQAIFDGEGTLYWFGSEKNPVDVAEKMTMNIQVINDATFYSITTSYNSSNGYSMGSDGKDSFSGTSGQSVQVSSSTNSESYTYTYSVEDAWKLYVDYAYDLQVRNGLLYDGNYNLRSTSETYAGRNYYALTTGYVKFK